MKDDESKPKTPAKTAYERAKEAAKRRRAAWKETPAAKALKDKQRERRRAEYQKAKEAMKARLLAREEARRAEAEAESERKDAELLGSLVTADKLPAKPRLRLVKSGDDK